MRIYMDEAGNFVPQASGQSLFSLVLALVVPSSIETKLFTEFSALLSSWPKSGTEIKGSKLDEAQAAQLIELASSHDVFVNFFAVDMATHGESAVSDFKARQAFGVTANLTPEHHPPIVAQLEELAAAIRRMPNPTLRASLPDDRIGTEGHPREHSLLRAAAPSRVRKHRVDYRPKGPDDHRDGDNLVDPRSADERGPFRPNTATQPQGGGLLAFRRTLRDRRR
jgi:hypothetical protein